MSRRELRRLLANPPGDLAEVLADAIGLLLLLAFMAGMPIWLLLKATS